MYHTATRMNASPSTRSNYHLTSHTQQTSFNGSRHLHHGRNSINHPGSLTGAPQISPISMEERLALTKNMDGTGSGEVGLTVPSNATAAAINNNNNNGVANGGSTTTTAAGPEGGGATMLMIVNQGVGQ
uniref:(northern house mosquito) hypothetical protein n=1 Tax=Culex pipiens TaxID=7175 RepID=A0A8D8L1C1_CULPI